MTQQHEHLPANHVPTIWKSVLIEIFIAILLIVFFYTGISKLIDRLSFEINLQQHSIFSAYAPLVSYGAPILEIVIAIALIFNKTRQAGLAAAATLMVFFTGYVVYMMITLPHLPCSCGGAVAWLSWPQHIIFNALLTVMAGITFILHRKEKAS